MRNIKNRILYLLLLELSISGCSRVPPADNGFVSCTVASRIGSCPEWRQGRCQDQRAQVWIRHAISHELTADAAIQIALLNNPQVQATFEELGIAQADLVEAGLLSNPSFGVEVRYPDIAGMVTNIEYLITTSLLDIFLVPLRIKLAAAEFEQTKLKVSNTILNLAFEVRTVYYELVAEREKIRYLQSIVELASIDAEIVAKQAAVNNVYILELQLAQSKLLEAELELAQSQAELIRLREQLNSLLGFCKDCCLIFPEMLPQQNPCQHFDLCSLESIALANRLDLQVARFEIIRLRRMLNLKEAWTYTDLQGGLAGEKDPDRVNLVGFGVAGEIPLFNYGQADRLRLFAQLRQAQDRLTALEITVLAEVREAYQLFVSYLKISDDYQSRLLPMYEKILISSEGLYNVMGLGVDKLLENKRQEMVAAKNYTESLKRCLLAKVQLNRALGGYLFRLLRQGPCPQEVCE